MAIARTTKLRLSILGSVLSVVGLLVSLRQLAETGLRRPTVIGIVATVIALILTTLSIWRSARTVGRRPSSSAGRR